MSIADCSGTSLPLGDTVMCVTSITLKLWCYSDLIVVLQRYYGGVTAVLQR
jgi:hypothetical protein